jgi:2-oxoglutarate ferredoxin oxidoreductase subunit alpha
MSSEVQSIPGSGSLAEAGSKVNNFTVTFGTINGSGSATANGVILRSLFRMGIPVSGKNIFPSNIQGLPTWFTIRVNKDGFLARVDQNDIVVAMNPATFNRDLETLVPGGALFYADDIKLAITRDDIIAYPMPVKKLSRESDVTPNMRDYIANMVYVGVLAQMLGIHLDIIYQALDHHFKGKKKAVDSNYNVVKAAASWAAENLEKKDVYRVEPMDETRDCIMTDGNVAAALGALYGGVQFVAWYPITPASSLAESVSEYLPKLRIDPDSGKTSCVVVQAEDELAAIGMAVGAGWGGLRSMTSTSGPGLSLMTEYSGLAYYAEVPLVIWDVQRVGPSTGLPTRTQHGDLTMVNFLGHGDTQHIALIPGNITECFEFAWRAFDLAEHFQTPVIILSDLDLGMNNWMADRFVYPDQPMDRGKVLWEEDLKRLNGQWGRYADVDGDGIPYRTIVGNRHPNSAWFARGTGHDENARYTEEPEVWERMMARLARKLELARQYVPKPEIDIVDGAEIGIITLGSAELSVQEARSILAAQGVKTSLMRVRSLPLSPEVFDFVRRYQRHYVVELNRDGQLRQLLMLNDPECAAELRQTSKSDGLPLTARWISEQILSKEGK